MNGNLSWEGITRPFGIETHSSDNGDTRKFAGKEFDSRTGLFYFNARYYDPLTGRFISVDPMAGSNTMPQTWNRYSYPNNNPVRLEDPTGMWGKDVHRELTECIALAIGMSRADARSVAFETNQTDDSVFTSPITAYQAYHAVDDQRLEELKQIAIETGSDQKIGNYIHALQDTFSHNLYPGRLGHAFIKNVAVNGQPHQQSAKDNLAEMTQFVLRGMKQSQTSKSVDVVQLHHVAAMQTASATWEALEELGFGGQAGLDWADVEADIREWVQGRIGTSRLKSRIERMLTNKAVGAPLENY
jgi:RHS repeat-associated protein